MKKILRYLAFTVYFFTLSVQAFECTNSDCYQIDEKNLVGAQKFIAEFISSPTKNGRMIFCDYDEKLGDCQGDDIGLPNISLLPPFQPWRASLKSLDFIPNDEKKNNFSLHVTYMKLKTFCKSSEMTLKVIDKKLNYSGVGYCNWLLAGNMVISYSFDIVAVDAVKNIIYTSYNFKIGGTAVGFSTGIAMLKLEGFEKKSVDLALLKLVPPSDTKNIITSTVLTTANASKEMISDSGNKVILAQNEKKSEPLQMSVVSSMTTEPTKSTSPEGNSAGKPSINTLQNIEIINALNTQTMTESSALKEANNAVEIEKYKQDAQQAFKRQKDLEEQLKLATEALNKNSKPKSEVRVIRARALVIGNSSYSGSSRLPNPSNDARAITLKLKELGFLVDEVLDANRNNLVNSLSKFARTATDADISLLYYAGHGVQISGVNYMLPVDLNMHDLTQVPLQGVSLSSVVEQFLPGKTKLVFLDACRDNPLMQTASRSVSRGLAPINVSEGTLISYSTKDGQVAQDGDGKNSPFTTALLEHLGDPDDIAVVLRKVREKVMKNTGGKQQPWEYGSLTGGALVLSAIKPIK
jgi:hypothetical protein